MKKYNLKIDGRDSLGQWYGFCWANFGGELGTIATINSSQVLLVVGTNALKVKAALKEVELFPEEMGFVPSTSHFFGAKYLFPPPKKQYYRGLHKDIYSKEEASHLFFGPSSFEVPKGEVVNRQTLIIRGGEIVFYRGLLITDPLLKRKIIHG